VKVVEASNFRDGKFEKTISGDLLEQGYHVGRQVVLMRRMSVDLPKGARIDVNKGDVGHIKGILGQKIVCKFFKVVKGVNREFDVALKKDNMSFDMTHARTDTDANPKCNATAPKAKAVAKALAYTTASINAKEGDVVVAFPRWETQLARDCVDMRLKFLHSNLGVALETVISLMPVFGKDDLAIVQRNQDIVEVWTLKEFAPFKLMFAPETNEFKDRNFTYGKSALVKYDVSCRNRYSRSYLIMFAHWFVVACVCPVRAQEQGIMKQRMYTTTCVVEGFWRRLSHISRV
jgi:hypothetical protein